MNTVANQSVDAVIYFENAYQGELEAADLTEIQSIDWTAWLTSWFESLSQTEDIRQDCELGLRLTGDRQIQALNQQYRSMAQPTDVLAFAATEAHLPLPLELSEPLYLGDIIISLDTALVQAKSQNHSLTMELAWLASHGVLHLLGWDHPDQDSLQKMLDRQFKLVELLNYKPKY